MESELVVAHRKPRPECCELCDRNVKLTFHHLIPRKVHRRKRMRKRFSKTTMHCHGIWVCQLCHSAIHAFVPQEQVLADSFRGLEELKNHPAIARHINWARKQKC